MSEMVERVARAICAAKGDDPDEKCEDWMREFSGWRGYQKSARAAIEAMREPTEAMIKAGEKEDDIGFCDEPGSNASAEAHWRAMVAEALK